MDNISMKKPAWALRELRKMGYDPDTTMDTLQEEWWGWYTRKNLYYNQTFSLGNDVEPCERLSMRPAAMVAGEVPSLVMTEGTQIVSQDDGCNSWIQDTMPNFVDEQSDLITNTFALGTGAWVAEFSGAVGNIKTSIKQYNAWSIIPLFGGGCAFVSVVTVAGVVCNQLQVHVFSQETGTQHIITKHYDKKNPAKELVFDEVTGDIDTGQTLPCWTLVKPSKANIHDEVTTLGVSVIEDAIDAFRLVDEAFNQLYWQVRLSLPRVIADDTGLKRDPKTGKVETLDTLNTLLYMPIQSATGNQPITIYNPDTHIADMVAALNNALGIMGQRTGFGVGYWSFNLNTGLKTATEVVAANSTLMRTIRRHEHAIENAIRDLIQGAYSAECAMNTGETPELPEVTMVWDDSVISDDKQDRDLMKDDIARGLCPKWRYLTTYYGMSEIEARTFTGETGDAQDVSLVEVVGE